ncbi:MAG: hypothetical protein ACI4EG_02355 [Fusicatenibacter sp.]
MLFIKARQNEEEGRSSKKQFLLTRENLENYKVLTARIKEEGQKTNGYAPYLIMQANHRGRYSNPGNKPAPMIAYRHPELEKYRPADDSCIVSDDYLKRLEEKFGEAAKLAKEAGFDAIDIKSCHGYLLAELSSAYTRPGIYGGYAYPYGFGVSEHSDLKFDPSEPIRLVRELHETYGLDLINLTMGNPYATTHVTRPFDHGKYSPEEHPLEGLDRMINGIGAVKSTVAQMTVLGSAPSYLRQYADPDFPKEIRKQGRIDPNQVCFTCGKCGDLIRAHKPTGCVIRDRNTYLPFYEEFLTEKRICR